MHSQIKIQLNSISKIGKYKKLKMTEHKADMNITKIEKYKKNLEVQSMKELAHNRSRQKQSNTLAN